MEKIIGIGEYALSSNKDDVLKTFALASCVGITIYCSERRAAGMVHIALPAPNNLSNHDSIIRPYYYANTAVPLLIDRMCSKYGCSKNALKIRIFGGADSLRKDIFHVGKKNLEITKKILTDMGLWYDSSQTGGKCSRTLELDVSNGNIKLTILPIGI